MNKLFHGKHALGLILQVYEISVKMCFSRHLFLQTFEGEYMLPVTCFNRHAYFIKPIDS